MTKALFMLGELDDDDLNWIRQVGRKKNIISGKILIYEGQRINALYIVLNGTFTVSLKALENKELARIYKGEVIGEISFIDPRPPLATVKTIEDSLVLEIPRLELTAKLQRNTAFASRFYRGISMCLADRMHGTIRRFSYDIELENPTLEQDSLTANMLEYLQLAQAKFNWLQENVNY